MPLREIFATYAGGIGLNSFLPAQAGTIAYLGMYRAIIVNSRMVTIVAGGIAQNLFYAVIGTLVYIYLFTRRAGAETEASPELTADVDVRPHHAARRCGASDAALPVARGGDGDRGCLRARASAGGHR